MGLWDKVKESLSEASKGAPPARFTAAGKPIVCDHCGHDAFGLGTSTAAATAPRANAHSQRRR